MGLLDVLRLDPTALKQAQRPATGSAVAAALVGTSQRAGFDPSAGGGLVRGGVDVEIVTRELPPLNTAYGDLKASATLKFQSMARGGEADPVGFSGAGTSKDKADGRKTGFKGTIAWTDIADRELFAGYTLEGFQIALEPEISGREVSVSATFKFAIVTKAFRAPTQAKVIVLRFKIGEKKFQALGIEIKIAPVSFPYQIGPVASMVFAEYKASFTLDMKKVGKEVLEKVAKQALKKEAKRQGVKALGRKGAEYVLRDLAPLAAAFSVGWDIGTLLNEYTIAPKVAGAVTEEFLGDLNERYHKADTLGKILLVKENAVDIGAAMVAAGVAGAVSGMADLVLFKLLGLDKLKDFGPALKAMQEGLSDMAAVVKAPVEALGGAMLHGALALGIKFNPKHAIVAHATLEPVVAAIFARIHPLYKMKGGLDKLLGVSVKDASLDPANFLKFATFAHGFKMNWDGQVDLSSPQTVAASLKSMHVGAFLRFLEANKMIRCNVALGDNLDPDAIDPKLLDELYG